MLLNLKGRWPEEGQEEEKREREQVRAASKRGLMRTVDIQGACGPGPPLTR